MYFLVPFQSKMTSRYLNDLEKTLLWFVMFPCFLPLSHPSVVLFFYSGFRGRKQPTCVTIIGSESQMGVKSGGSSGRLNKQNCSMIHKLPEAAPSIKHFKHPTVMFLKRYETSYM